MFRYIDIALILFAAPILLLTGAPAAGYGIGAATWIALRLLERGVDRHALAERELSQVVAFRLGYRFTRVALLALSAVLVEKWVGRRDGLTALLVILFAFTIQLGWSIAHHLSPLPGARTARSAAPRGESS